MLVLAGALIATGVAAGGLLLSEAIQQSSPPVTNPRTKAFAGPPVITVEVIPGRPAQVVSPNGDVLVSLKLGSVDEPIELLYQPVAPHQIPYLPAGYVSSRNSFNLSVADEGGELATSFSFNNPITITIRLSPEDVRLAGGVVSNVVIQYHNVGNGQWTPLPTRVDFSSSMAQTQVTHLSIFALTIRAPKPAPMVEPIAVPTSTPAKKPTATPPPSPNLSPAPSPTASASPTAPSTSRPRPTGLPTTEPTAVPTATAKPTPTMVPTPTPTFTATLVPTSTPAPTQTPLPPTPTHTPVPTPTRATGYKLAVNGVDVAPTQSVLHLESGTLVLSRWPGFDGKFPINVPITLIVYPETAVTAIIWGGVDTHRSNVANLTMNQDRFVTLQLGGAQQAPTAPAYIDTDSQLVPTPTPVYVGPATPTPTPTHTHPSRRVNRPTRQLPHPRLR